jgi:hypothetical protein
MTANSNSQRINLPALDALEPSKFTYSSSLSLKVLISQIPYLGSVIDGIITHKEDELQEQRLKYFLGSLKEGIEKIDERTIQKEWVNSEEFYDILRQAISSSIKSRSKEKALINVRILLNVLGTTNEGQFRPEEYLHSIEELTTTEVKALLVIYQEFTSKEREDSQNDLQFARTLNWKEKIIQHCGIDEEDIEFVIKRLEKTGFITEITGAYFSYSGGQIKITQSFIRFMNYISNPSNLDS